MSSECRHVSHLEQWGNSICHPHSSWGYWEEWMSGYVIQFPPRLRMVLLRSKKLTTAAKYSRALTPAPCALCYSLQRCVPVPISQNIRGPSPAFHHEGTVPQDQWVLLNRNSTKMHKITILWRVLKQPTFVFWSTDLLCSFVTCARHLLCTKLRDNSKES